MKRSQLVGLIVVLAMVLVFVALVGGRALAATRTRPWSSVGAACAPDYTTRYASNASSGYAEHASGVTGDLYFVCNVTTPIDSYSGEPDWSRLYLTFKDPDTRGYVQATLYKKKLSDGAVTSMGTTLKSTDGSGIRQSSVSVSSFDFDAYAYFVKIQIYRSSTSSDQEFHIVRLQP